MTGISLTSRAGQTTAIVGSTGAGKTTLVNLVPRLFDVTGGAVLVDGVDVRDLEPELLWGRIGLVPQKPYLFTGTVASNLRYGKPDATDDEMWDGARDRPGPRLRVRDAGWPRCPDRAGRHQRLRWPAPAAGHRPGHRPPPGDLPVRRLVLGARPGHRRPPARRPRAAHGERDRARRRPAGLDDRHADQILVLEDGRTVGLGTHDELLGQLPDLRRDRRVAGRRQGGGMSTPRTPDPRPNGGVGGGPNGAGDGRVPKDDVDSVRPPASELREASAAGG